MDDARNRVVYMGKPKPGARPLRLGLPIQTSPATLQTGQGQPDLEKAMDALIGSSEATASFAAAMALSIRDDGSLPTPSGQEMARVSLLRRQASQLRDMAESLGRESELYIRAYVASSASPGSLQDKMLAHFGSELESIVARVLDGPCGDVDVLREVLETCHRESLEGCLHPDNYLVPLSGACLSSPYDPGWEVESFYSHEGSDQPRASSNEASSSSSSSVHAYRAAQRRMSTTRQKEHERSSEQWTRFWVEALDQCHRGPTLFYPPASRHPECQLAPVPRYLFRVFDDESVGTLDDDVVSPMGRRHTRGVGWRDRVDLLSLREDEAAAMLFRHLNTVDFAPDECDNLVSWSSSLLCVVQYALWRCYARRPRGGEDGWQTPHNVRVCAVDTRKFPRGQFAHSKSLLRPFRQAATSATATAAATSTSSPSKEEGGRMADFFNFRLDNDDYDHGEYLSQGTLYRAGRSCVVSLAQLVSAGLYQLYPELDDPPSRRQWSKRVDELRNNMWAHEHRTSRAEVQQALRIAQKCFKALDPGDVALVLLLFKNRKLRSSITKESRLTTYRPIEVRRYMEILHRQSSSAGGSVDGSSIHAHDSPEQMLETIFDLRELKARFAEGS